MPRFSIAGNVVDAKKAGLLLENVNKLVFLREKLPPILHPVSAVAIMVYGSMPYVGMAPTKNGGHIKSAQMTRLKCRC